jgi:hypothetical protein
MSKDEDFDTDFIELDSDTPDEVITRLENTDSEAASIIAMAIMDTVSPGFIVVCSPIYETSDNGHTMPSGLALAINEENWTKSMVAAVLQRLVKDLEKDIRSVEEGANRNE